MATKGFDAKSIEIDLTGEHFLQTKLVGISNDLKTQPRDLEFCLDYYIRHKKKKKCHLT